MNNEEFQKLSLENDSIILKYLWEQTLKEKMESSDTDIKLSNQFVKTLEALNPKESNTESKIKKSLKEN